MTPKGEANNNSQFDFEERDQLVIVTCWIEYREAKLERKRYGNEAFIPMPLLQSDK